MASFASLPAKGLPPRPPDKGSFPLDHFRECSELKSEYMGCLKQHSMQIDACRDLSASYLQCRMDRKLMAPEELERLGFAKKEAAVAVGEGDQPVQIEEKKRAGFVAGMSKANK
mmetsp:Transcript_22983/g.67718  ORF Transcript_22983/g.67718 Transcript_22983/m.67718 type:complete len:114 (-) Transcript_22983:39-380(-)